MRRFRILGSVKVLAEFGTLGGQMADSETTATAHATLHVGPSAILAYSRLNYTLWYALAEFVDNSTQSVMNYDNIIAGVLKDEGIPLKVDIVYDRDKRTLTVTDNSIGMNKDTLINALKIATPTKDSKGRSKYGMGMKTAACWIGNKWAITTCQWASGEEWTASVDVNAIAAGTDTVPLTMRAVGTDHHGTRIVISDLNRSIQRRTEETIMMYLGSMYRMDIRRGELIINFNGNQVRLPDDLVLAQSVDGQEQKRSIDVKVGGKQVTGWFGVLRDGGRKFGGFSIFQNDRQIRGFPDGWKPRSVFGGVDDEGSNTLVAQRLVGELILNGFDVSHTKDAILFRGTEEEELEKYLATTTQELKNFALTMRKGVRTNSWSREKVKELLEGMKQEFGSSELKDAVVEAALPPLDVIKATNQKQVEALESEDMLWSLEVFNGLTVRVYLQDRTPNDPHLTIASNKDGFLNIVINQQHPYYIEIDSTERADEIIRQYIYDAVAEYRVGQRMQIPQPDAIRKLKDTLLRAKMERINNSNEQAKQDEFAKLDDVSTEPA